MQIVNSKTAYPIGVQVENINRIGMRGVPEKQGWSFSAHGWRMAKENPSIDPDAFGKMFRQALRPLSRPTLDKARQEYQSKTVIPFPRYFIIEPTAVCNRACPFCTILVTNRKGMMKWNDFKKLMEECGEFDVYGISLYQLGEPFLWRRRGHGADVVPPEFISTDNYSEPVELDISDMVNYARQVGGFKIVNLSTNGDVSNLDCILGSELSDLIISIDGTTAEVRSEE